MKLWILLQIAVLAALCSAQQDCHRGACYPPAEDLLLDRETYLRASSTCGLNEMEVFCTTFAQHKLKCCPCDSRSPSSPTAHRIQNVLSSAGPNRWWQSQKGVSPVTLHLDLPYRLQLDTLVLEFKGPRPNALVIERSTDMGRTWHPALYLAANCRSAFPGVRTSLPRSLTDTYCYTLPPLSATPYLDQTIYFSPMQEFSTISIPQSQKAEAAGFTNLRVRLTQLGTVPRMHGRPPSLFYALKEMRVMGSCFCHGHANHCRPDTSTNLLTSTEVSPVCECQHNTAGVNCERCDDLYNDLPWRPAEDGQTHTCKRCECNNHAHRCRFDLDIYEQSGRRSGGVCEGCLHNTEGPHCNRCTAGYYRNSMTAMDHPDACLWCQCSAPGTKAEAVCHPETGACLCKANVEGPRCDRCKPGYYGLSADNPLGCSKCSCGSDSPCNPVTGQCRCPTNVQGLDCDHCAPNYWNLRSPGGCEPCSCDPNNSYGTTCDQLTGQCQCRPGFGGRTCTECPGNTYGDPRTGCLPCKCDQSGAVNCDKHTGVCRCHLGMTGPRCDSCARGHCDKYPFCPPCPACFSTLDQELQILHVNLKRLSSQASDLSSVTLPDLDHRIRALEVTLAQIQDSVRLPLKSTIHMTNVLKELHRLRDLANKLDPASFPTDESQALARELEDLRATLQTLALHYNDKRNAIWNNSSYNYEGPYSTIKTAYQNSTDAMKAAEESMALLEQAAGARADAISQEGHIQQTNTNDLEKLDYSLAKGPNLTPVAHQVCGSRRSIPCTPQKCDGQLCPDSISCRQEEGCFGALPLGNKALEESKEANTRLQDFNAKIAQAEKQIQETQDSANRVRLTADKLATEIKQARDNMDADMKKTQDFVKKLKDFLSDPASDPAVIQAISDGVLSTKLPLSVTTLMQKVEEIHSLATKLPDSSAMLDSTGPQLERARRLLMEARTTRDDAIEVQNRVDVVMENVSKAENVLEDLEAKIQDSLDAVDQANENIAKAEAELHPIIMTMEEVDGLVKSMQPQLDNLKTLVQSGEQLANQAQGQAQAAQREATAASESIPALEKQLKILQEKAKEAGGTDGEGVSGEKLKKLQEEASALIQETTSMMQSLADQETSLQEATDQVFQKTQELNGLEALVEDILADIRQKAYLLTHCQG